MRKVFEVLRWAAAAGLGLSALWLVACNLSIFTCAFTGRRPRNRRSVHAPSLPLRSRIGAVVVRYVLPASLLFGHAPPVSAMSAPQDPDFHLGSSHRGNYVWCGAMNLAWNELNENVIHGKLQLDTRDQRALDMVGALNNSPFGSRDLDEASSYVGSGFGQGTVDRVNREVRAKFPGKSFQDLGIRLQKWDIIAYAYVLKQVEYLTSSAGSRSCSPARPSMGSSPAAGTSGKPSGS